MLAALVVVLALSIGAHTQTARSEHWVSTWGTALIGRPAPAPPAAPAPSTTTAAPSTTAAPTPRAPVNITSQTIRQIVHASVGGSRIRIVLSNVWGTAPLVVGAAHVALRAAESAIVPESARTLTFGGRESIMMPAGAVLVSDPVDLTVASFADLAIDLYLPGDTSLGSVTVHNSAVQRNYLSKDGNFSGAVDFEGPTPVQSWFLLSRVEVMAPEAVSAIVTFGDSITDGTASTVGANRRWPDLLAKRLGGKFAVLNAGIAGNRLMSDSTPGFGTNALARFDRDVLVQTGVTHVIVLEGINDIGGARQSPTPTSDDLIAVHRQLIARAHARGLKIIGGTLTPFEGAAYFTPQGEEKRRAVNTWIRTSNAYDGVIDFDAAVRDPKQPGRFQPQLQSGDNLHPSDAGYEAMANAIDLKLFAR
jgi:lysophospholipase L1-like esterase